MKDILDATEYHSDTYYQIHFLFHIKVVINNKIIILFIRRFDVVLYIENC